MSSWWTASTIFSLVNESDWWYCLWAPFVTATRSLDAARAHLSGSLLGTALDRGPHSPDAPLHLSVVVIHVRQELADEPYGWGGGVQRVKRNDLHTSRSRMNARQAISST